MTTINKPVTLDDMDRLFVFNPGTENEITLGDYVENKVVETLRSSLRLEVEEGGVSVKIRLLADISDAEYFIDSIEFDI